MLEMTCHVMVNLFCSVPSLDLLLHNLGKIYGHTHSSPSGTKQQLGQGRHQENDLAGKYVINNVDLS